MKSRRWSVPMKETLWHGVRRCWTAWKRRSPCWRKDTTTWRSCHTLMITYTFYRWGQNQRPFETLAFRRVSSLTSYIILPELAVSVRPLRIRRPQQHHCCSILLLWRYQESHCYTETSSRRSQQDWNGQNLRSRWAGFVCPVLHFMM